MSPMIRVTCHLPADLLSQINASLNAAEYETFPHFVRVSLLREVQRRLGGSKPDAPHVPHTVVSDAVRRANADVDALMSKPTDDDSRFGSLPPRQPKPPPVTEADIPPFLRRENRKP